MQRVVAILGPTATGKSDLAMALAERLGGEIVNADALQIYRGLDIGTAKPSAEDRRRVPHHLLDVADPSAAFSAGEFARRARRAIAAISRRGRVALVVGGSGLYLRALFDGLSPLPPADPELRQRLRERLEREGLAPLRAELERLDPPTAERLERADTQRILRALEVALGTGRPLSEWIERPPEATGPEADRIGLTLPRGILYDRVSGRVERMVEAGWVEEVERLLDRGHSASDPAFQAIGYRQLARHLAGEWTLEQALEDTVRATRRYAKRQSTWFRRDHRIHWFSAVDRGQLRRQVVEFLAQRGPRYEHA